VAWYLNLTTGALSLMSFASRRAASLVAKANSANDPSKAYKLYRCAITIYGDLATRDRSCLPALAAAYNGAGNAQLLCFNLLPDDERNQTNSAASWFTQSALSMFRESERIYRGLARAGGGYRENLAGVISTIGNLAIATGDWPRAAVALNESEQIYAGLAVHDPIYREDLDRVRSELSTVNARLRQGREASAP
jgi:hypothetical protein